MHGSLFLRSHKHLSLRVRQQSVAAKPTIICARRSVRVLDGSKGPEAPTKVTSGFPDIDVDDCDTNLAADYCSIDEDGR